MKTALVFLLGIVKEAKFHELGLIQILHYPERASHHYKHGAESQAQRQQIQPSVFAFAQMKEKKYLVIVLCIAAH